MGGAVVVVVVGAVVVVVVGAVVVGVGGAVVPGAVVPGAVVPGAVVPGAVVPGAVVPGAVVPGAVVPVGALGAATAKTGVVLPIAATGPALVGTKNWCFGRAGVAEATFGKSAGGAPGWVLVVGGTVVVVGLAVVGVSELELRVGPVTDGIVTIDVLFQPFITKTAREPTMRTATVAKTYSNLLHFIRAPFG